MKIYEIYTTGPGGAITHKSVDYGRGGYPWIVKVRASSLQEASQLLIRQTVSVSESAGVMSVDRSAGPPKEWPWDMDKDTVAPQWRE